MDSCLLVCGTIRHAEGFAAMTGLAETVDLTVGTDLVAARGLISAGKFDFLVTDYGIFDEEAADFSVMAAETTKSCPLLVTSLPEDSPAVQDAWDAGVYVIRRPVDIPEFRRAMRLLRSVKLRMEHFDRENRELQRRMEESKLINRAKCVLIQYLNMTEEQAHKYIEKQAMNMRRSRTSVAESILRTYDEIGY